MVFVKEFLVLVVTIRKWLAYYLEKGNLYITLGI